LARANSQEGVVQVPLGPGVGDKFWRPYASATSESPLHRKPVIEPIGDAVQERCIPDRATTYVVAAPPRSWASVIVMFVVPEPSEARNT